MSYFTSSKFVTELTPKDFDQTSTWKLRTHRCSIVMFYANWCPHCKALLSTWESLAETAAFFDVCAFDCANYPGWCNRIKEDMPGIISGYPSIIVYERGEPKEKAGTTLEERTVPELIKACMRGCSST